MVFAGLLAKAASTVVTGAIGAAAYDGARKAAAKAPLRDAAVIATEWGLRGVRKVGESAETARKNVAGVVAEAKGRIDADQLEPVDAEVV